MASRQSAYELLIQNVVDYAIYMLSPEGLVRNWNAGAQRIKGYSAAEIVGEHFSRFYTPEDRDAGMPRRALDIARRDGRFEAEGWRVRKDGTRFWAGVVIDAIYEDSEIIGFAKITRDLTERRNAQLQLEASRELLFQSQKMEAVGQLTGGLAHDFNNLLTAIIGSLEQIKARIAQGRAGEVGRYIDIAQTASTRASSLTHRLLAFARRQTLDPKAVDPNQQVVEMEDLIRRTMGPGITVSCQLPSDIWLTLCDPNQLENAILNLCINARDAMPGGGELTIETANVRLDEAVARDRDMKPGEYVEICVTDSGAGMPPDVISRAFEPFFTTKPIGQGTGLGLSMIYGFARQSNGQVRIHSKVDAGTSVHMFLPRHLGEAPSHQTSQHHQATPSGSGETILVVDDEPGVRMLIREVLEEHGYRTLEASNSREGLDILKSDAAIDLLVSDVGLPGGLNGRQMADAARGLRPALQVLFITGYAAQAVVGSGVMEAGMHVLAKPFSVDALAGRIKQILAKC